MAACSGPADYPGEVRDSAASPHPHSGASRNPAGAAPLRDRLSGAPLPYEVTADLAGRTAATLTVGDAASRVVVRAVTLPGRLYRISTPAGSGLAPRLAGAPGRQRLTLVPTGADGPDAVEILLNRAVRWDLRLPAGAGEKHLDLTSGRLRRLVLGSAAGLVTLRLPRPAGPVPIVVTGPVGELTAEAPAGTPVRLRLRGGAGWVTVPWATPEPAAPGVVTATADYRTVRGRYAVDVRPEAGRITVTQPAVSAGRCVPSCSAGTPGRGR